MSAASHQKLANLNASADVTNSSSVEAAGAIMDTDFTSNGLMKRTEMAATMSFPILTVLMRDLVIFTTLMLAPTLELQRQALQT